MIWTLTVFVPVLFSVLFCASQVGIRLAVIEEVDRAIYPFVTADYSLWPITPFAPVNVQIATRIAEENTPSEATLFFPVALVVTDIVTLEVVQSPVLTLPPTDEEQATALLSTIENGVTPTARAARTLTNTPTSSNTASVTATATSTSVLTSVPPPVANFLATPNSGFAPLTVSFTNRSSGSITGYLWDFGNGQTSTSGTPPSQVYSAAGVYTVTLTVTGAGGTNTTSQVITVNQAIVPTATLIPPTHTPVPPTPTSTPVAAPVANFIVTPNSGFAPLTVSFTNGSSGSITGYLWDFGNGQTSTSAAPPAQVYSTVGVYTVRLTVTGAGGTNTISQVITVNQPIVPTATPVPLTPTSTPVAAPVANFIASPTSGFAPLTVSFTNRSSGSITGYLWDFGNGQTNTSVTPPPHVYNLPGVYTVRLIVTGAGGTNTMSQVITVNQPIVPTATPVPPTPTATIIPVDISVSLSPVSTSRNEQDTFDYVLSVTNHGSTIATNIRSQLTLQSGLTPYGNNCGCYNGNTNTWLVSALNPGQTTSVFVYIRVDAGTGGSVLNASHTFLSVDQGDANSANNVVGASVSVNPVPTATPLPPPVNLIADPSFESGTICCGWYSFGDYEVINGESSSGSYAGRMGGQKTGFFQRIQNLTPGTTYVLRGWAKAANGTDQVFIGAKEFDGTPLDLQQSTTSTTYTQLTVSFTTGPTDTSALIYCWKEWESPDNVYCDDLSLFRQ